MSPRVRQVATAIAEEHGVRLSDLMGPSRARKVCEARWHVWAALREGEKPLSLLALEDIFARDHSTICHGLRQWARITAGEPRRPRNERHRLKTEIARSEARLVMLRARLAELDDLSPDRSFAAQALSHFPQTKTGADLAA
jgi:hypothetical protein